jgi:hypothetical protein
MFQHLTVLESQVRACACSATGASKTCSPPYSIVHFARDRKHHKSGDLNPTFPTIDTLNSLQLCNNDFDRKIKVN